MSSHMSLTTVLQRMDHRDVALYAFSLMIRARVQAAAHVFARGASSTSWRTVCGAWLKFLTGMATYWKKNSVNPGMGGLLRTHCKE